MLKNKYKTMTDRHIYIKSMSMIPSDDAYSDYSAFLTPMEGRRMGKLMKRALATSLTALRNAGLEHPDAIVTGTSLGSVADMEPVLNAVCENGGESVKPTNFMQSTHNTLSSLIALRTGTHGYNCTWSQECLSFEDALADAMTQLRLGRISNALVGAFDELSPDAREVQRRGGILRDACKAGEAAASFVLEADGADPVMSGKPGSADASVAGTSPAMNGRAAENGRLVEVVAVRTAYIPDEKCQEEELSAILEDMLGKAGLAMCDIDFVLTGRHGVCPEACSGVSAEDSSRKSQPFPEGSLRESQPFHDEFQSSHNDAVYERLNGLWQGTPQGLWKHVFGEGFSSSSTGFHLAASSLLQGFLPNQFQLLGSGSDSIRPDRLPTATSQQAPRNIITFNHFAAKHFSLMLLHK